MMRRRPGKGLASSVGVAMVALLASGCADPAPGDRAGSEIFFPTWSPPGGMTPGGILEGRLVERDRCLLMEVGEERYLPLWPDSFALEGGATPVISSPDGRTLAVGDRAFLGGGERRLVDAEDMIGRAIPTRCRTSLYWIATAIEDGT